MKKFTKCLFVILSALVIVLCCVLLHGINILEKEIHYAQTLINELSEQYEQPLMNEEGE